MHPQVLKVQLNDSGWFDEVVSIGHATFAGTIHICTDHHSMLYRKVFHGERDCQTTNQMFFNLEPSKTWPRPIVITQPHDWLILDRLVRVQGLGDIGIQPLGVRTNLWKVLAIRTADWTAKALGFLLRSSCSGSCPPCLLFFFFCALGPLCLC